VHLLVTRPEPDAATTAERLRAIGHRVMIEPLLRIAFAPPPGDLPNPTALIVTSRNGLRALAAWPQAAAWRGLPLFANGDVTAQLARSAGFTEVSSTGGDAASLIRLMEARLTSNGPVLYVAAHDRAGALATRLRRSGYDIRVVEAYNAERATRLSPGLSAALAAGEIDGALFYSRRTSETFRQLVEGMAIRLTHAFALSRQVAVPIERLAANIHVAASPDEASILALIPPP
jgi:uroporphyrinogen-III synthase